LHLLQALRQLQASFAVGVLRLIEEAQFSFSRVPGREFVRVEKCCESACCVSICTFFYSFPLGLTSWLNNKIAYERETSMVPNKVSYRSMGTTGDPVPVDQRDVPVNHFTG
jgi:hypothetical protein